ncbi:DUF3470 domain-containing protein [Salmonella enterica]|nr:DUF3470 domain-containing protein [Salmonella enterica]
MNSEYSAKWPNLTVKKDQMPEAAEMDGVANKLEQFFSAEPGEGD